MIGVFGGTFDPVHFGHLRPALDVMQALELREMRLIPAFQPPHRDPPQANARQRINMLRAAVGNDTPGLLVDNREMQREGISYMVDTLESLRASLGDEPICLVLGADAFRKLHTWHRWRDMPALAHLVVTHRPGWTLDPADPELDPELAALWRAARVEQVDELRAAPVGKLFQLAVSQLDISATRIRALVAEGKSPRFLVPDSVWNLIRLQGLYNFKARYVDE